MSEYSEKVLFDLSRRRTWCVKSLRTHLVKIQRIATEDLKRLDEKGIVGYYSQNHDILKCAVSVWKTSFELGVLKSMEKDIEEAFNELSTPVRGGSDLYVDPFDLPGEELEKLQSPPEEADANPEEKEESKNEE